MSAFGIYVHVPFCAAKCDYCAFATWTDRAHLVDRYVDAVITELARLQAQGCPPATSVFVGGGTPSLLPPDRLAEMIEAVAVRPGAEITVECNPDDVGPELLDAITSAGADRVSLGVQSTSAHVLAALGRSHDPDHVTRAVETIRSSSLRSFNLDLIYGAVGEGLDDWERVVDEVLSFAPPHVSAYALMPEPGTPVGLDPRRHPDDDDQADKYRLIDDALHAVGLVNYEVSNWAHPGHESAHNRLYWAQGDYIGVGCAAHSHRRGRRWWNVRTPERYIALIDEGRSVEAAGETLDEPTRRFERLQLALRTSDGVERAAFTPEQLRELDGFVRAHSQDPDRVVLTQAGRLLADDITTRFAENPLAYDAAEGA